ncbi:uncharacterized protein LOC106013676 [Aplysia californica]|uniref:Uncharacterized protein LOC106013676 n=1 Tax=Aplysia californica TaxID=6500 RepID=A0ABM1AD96_APLCA|nr:uncharacterized protein LOC106013676 [Aplysia californica]
MNLTTVFPPAHNVMSRDPVSDELRASMTIAFSLCLHTSIITTGCVTNVINAIIFLRLGLSDSISVSFFFLAISDFVILFQNLLARVFGILDSYLGVNFGMLDIRSLGFLLTTFASVPYDITVCITLYTAVQKCCCVVFPFRFNRVFTRSRSIFINIFIYLVVVCYHIPAIASQHLRLVRNPSSNSTKLSVWFSPDRNRNVAALGLLRNVVITTAEIVVSFCVIVFAYKLKASSQFHSIRAKGEFPSQKEEGTVDPEIEENGKTRGNETDTKRKNKTGQNGHQTSSGEGRVGSSRKNQTSKEVRATQAVTMVSTLFVSCTLTSVVIIYVSLLYPAFSPRGELVNLYYVTVQVRLTLIFAWLSLNIVVYCAYNTRFRNELFKIFCPKSQ